MLDQEKWEKVGVVGVDAGLLWLGDPCYCVTPDATEHPAKSWKEFCNKLFCGTFQWNNKAGHEGLGVTAETGYGDGTYPVEVLREDGRIKAVRVRFF